MTWALRLLVAAVSCGICFTVQAQPSWSMQLSAEGGIGLRNVELPRDGVVYEVSSGAYPVLGVGFDLAYHSTPHWNLSLSGRYQSSVGLILHERLTDGTDHPRKTRSHQVEVGLSPLWKLGDQGWALQGSLGYALSELDPENHLETPAYYLAGPYARLMLRVPLGSERVLLCLGPLGQMIVSTGSELSDRGVAGSGMAAGVDAALVLGLGEHWGLALSYREQHAWLASHAPAASTSFSDVTRLATLQLRGQL